MASGMPGFFDFDERLKELSAKGDDLERLKAVVDFEMFRPAGGGGSPMFLIATTSPATCGPTRPTARRRTKRC